MRDGLPWVHIVSIGLLDRSAFVSFSCGSDVLDSWLQGKAFDALKRQECVTHVCIDEAGMPLAFFTLSATSIESCDVSRGMQGGLHGPIPATLLGKMGVRADMQGQGLGTRVLRHAMLYAFRSSRIVSSRLLVVDALNADLVPWYEERRFRRLPDSERRLVLKMSEIQRICENQPSGYFEADQQEPFI